MDLSSSDNNHVLDESDQQQASESSEYIHSPSDMVLDEEDDSELLAELSDPSSDDEEGNNVQSIFSTIMETEEGIRAMDAHFATSAALPSPKSTMAPSYTAQLQAVPGPQPGAEFSLLHALIQRPDLLFFISTVYLPIEALINLHLASKALHNHINANFTSYIVSAARHSACLPASTPTHYAATTSTKVSLIRIFPHTYYPELCISDPALYPPLQQKIRENATDPPKRTPSFRYLHFLNHRAKVIHAIILLLGAEGHRIPLPSGAAALAKLWFLLDMRFNAPRINLIHSHVYWPNVDLRLAVLFCLKLDMAFSHPIYGARRVIRGSQGGLRGMMFAQLGLETMLKVLRRTECSTRLEVVRMWVRWRFQLPANVDPSTTATDIFGVPIAEAGQLQLEGSGARGRSGHSRVPTNAICTVQRARLLRPDELVIKECVRRRLNIGDQLVDMMLGGWIAPNGKNAPMPVPEMVEWAQGATPLSNPTLNHETQDDQEPEDQEMGED